MNKHFKIKDLTAVSLMTAFMCIFSPFSIPVGPVPVTLGSFFVCLSSILLGFKKGFFTYVIYLLLGAFGLPVFSGFVGGFSALFGLTGGFLIGFLLLSAVGGYVYESYNGKMLPSIIGFLMGTLLNYICGIAWFVFVTKSTIISAFMICVLPFIIFDVLKILIAYFFGTKIRKILNL